MTTTRTLAGLLLALAGLIAGLPAEAKAQRALRAGVGSSDRALNATVLPTSLGHSTDPSTLQPRRSMRPFLIGGALVGAMVGGALASSFNDSFCGEPAPGYSCSTTSPVAGALIGAGIGLFAGWLLWALTNPTESPPGTFR